MNLLLNEIFLEMPPLFLPSATYIRYAINFKLNLCSKFNGFVIITNLNGCQVRNCMHHNKLLLLFSLFKVDETQGKLFQNENVFLIKFYCKCKAKRESSEFVKVCVAFSFLSFLLLFTKE